jgi:hypothetical protein
MLSLIDRPLEKGKNKLRRLDFKKTHKKLVIFTFFFKIQTPCLTDSVIMGKGKHNLAAKS